MSFGTGRIVFALEAPFDGASTMANQWQPELGFPPRGFQVFSNPDVTGGVCRDQALDLMRSYVESHTDATWLQAMLPGFAYPDDAA
jgi:tRNA(adenine34) deaminase